MESNNISKRRKLSKPQESKPKEKLPNQKLPSELLLILFAYFPIPDLVTVQRVCSGWRAASQHKSLWKNFTLTLSGVPEDEKYIRTMPAVKNINGRAKNNILHIILENIIEVVQINIIFTPPLSSLQTQSILEKYPEVESITLDIYAPDFSESLHLLKTSNYLKRLEMVAPISYIHTENAGTCYKYAPSSLLNILFENRENFPALTNIDIPDSCSDVFKDIKFVNAFIDVVNKRSQQLLSLKVIVYDIERENLINAINMCTNIQKLHVDLHEEGHACLHIERMSKLISLHLDISHSTSFLPMFCDSIYKGSWIGLRKLNLSVPPRIEFQVDMLRLLIENMRYLRELTYYDDKGITSEEELKEISNLSQLETLSIYALGSVSEKGMGYLSQCQNLRHLFIYARESREDEWNLNIAIMINQMKKLEHLVFHVREKCFAPLVGRHKIDEFLDRFAHLFEDNTSCNATHVSTEHLKDF